MAEKVEDEPIKDEKEIEKVEQLKEQLEELGKAVEAEVTEETEKLDESKKEKTEGPITMFLKSQETTKQIEILKGLTGTGMAKTQKNVIIFYKHATSIGERIRGLVFLLVGLSIITTGLFANFERMFSLKELLLLINTLAGGWAGRLIVAGVGISLAAYGTDKLFSGVRAKYFPPKKKPEKYVQKKLFA